MSEVALPKRPAWMEESGAAHHRMAIGGGFLAAVALAVSFSFGTPEPGHAETGITMKAREVARLQSVDQGEGAEIVVEGESAQERNALIPTSSLARVSMGGFSGIKLGSAQYNTALKCLTQAWWEPAKGKALQEAPSTTEICLPPLPSPTLERY